jgi:hypothetical protein
MTLRLRLLQKDFFSICRLSLCLLELGRDFQYEGVKHAMHLADKLAYE